MSLEVNKEEDLRNDGVKISLPLTKANLGYIPFEGLTDEDIYWFLGKKAAQGLEAPQTKMLARSKTKELNWKLDKEGLIEYGKNKIMPLVPDEEEFIPRKYWCDLRELLGSNLNNESHPLWSLSHQILKDNFVKNSDTMLIQACGNYKPYIDNPVYRYALRLQRYGYCDFFITSWELTPVDFSPFFPYRYYDWNHAKETPFMTKVCVDHEFRNIIDIVEYFGYKKIILYSPPIGDDFYTQLNAKLSNFFKNTNVEYYFIWDEETTQKAKDDYGITRWAILKARYCQLKPGRDKLNSLLGYNGEVIDSKDWKYGIKNKDLIKSLRGNKDLAMEPKIEKRPRRKMQKENLWD